MGCDLAVVVMKGPGMVMKLERFFQNVPSINFHAMLTNEKKLISWVSKSESDFKGSKIVIHLFMQHICATIYQARC